MSLGFPLHLCISTSQFPEKPSGKVSIDSAVNPVPRRPLGACGGGRDRPPFNPPHALPILLPTIEALGRFNGDDESDHSSN